MIDGREPRAIPAEALEHLRGADPNLSDLVARLGEIEYNVDPDVWRALVGSIVGQQLSLKAAATIRARVAALGGDAFPSPATILAATDEELRACGLSRAKVSYLRDLGRAWLAGDIDPPTLVSLDDEEVIDRLVRVRGVGRWTAEMVLIFSLARPDVLAVDDLGIRSAVARTHGLAERPGREELYGIGEAWRPYRSFASIYLWRSLAEQP